MNSAPRSSVRRGFLLGAALGAAALVSGLFVADRWGGGAGFGTIFVIGATGILIFGLALSRRQTMNPLDWVVFVFAPVLILLAGLAAWISRSQT